MQTVIVHREYILAAVREDDIHLGAQRTSSKLHGSGASELREGEGKKIRDPLYSNRVTYCVQLSNLGVEKIGYNTDLLTQLKVICVEVREDLQRAFVVHHQDC